jgi:hypothetical protein
VRDRLGVGRPGDVGDQLPEHGVAAVAGPDDPARTARADHRAGQCHQIGDGVGEQLGRIADPGGVAEQFPDGDGVISQAHHPQVVVGGAIETDAAVTDEPQHRGGGDECSDAQCREPVASVQGLAPV